MAQELKNNVIARDYVEKNYIKKQDLLNFIEKELELIENGLLATTKMMSKDAIDGMKSSYLALYHWIKE